MAMYRGVTPRKRRVSRNDYIAAAEEIFGVTPRKRRVSRNNFSPINHFFADSHASQEACE